MNERRFDVAFHSYATFSYQNKFFTVGGNIVVEKDVQNSEFDFGTEIKYLDVSLPKLGWEMSSLSPLKSRRRGHSVLLENDNLYVVGGLGVEKPVEICSFSLKGCRTPARLTVNNDLLDIGLRNEEKPILFSFNLHQCNLIDYQILIVNTDKSIRAGPSLVINLNGIVDVKAAFKGMVFPLSKTFFRVDYS